MGARVVSTAVKISSYIITDGLTVGNNKSPFKFTTSLPSLSLTPNTSLSLTSASNPTSLFIFSILKAALAVPSPPPLCSWDSWTGSGIPRSGPRHCLEGILPPILVPTGKISRLRVSIQSVPRGDPRRVRNFDIPRYIMCLLNVKMLLNFGDKGSVLRCHRCSGGWESPLLCSFGRCPFLPYTN
ncbi:hypothetical protein PIB30_030056 [Stylosanthes scabra]|uniref:Uncharacterized protein n=1 Tax=Stylosanthes scabra TaxID=79078 RepID=A0ABU6UBT8_9FABA|nr:hypothetical protein [Stylosanthes scabra]